MSLDRVLNVTATVLVVVLAGFALRRELAGVQPQADPMDPSAPTVQVPDWEDVRSAGIPYRQGDGRVSVAVFEDLQCPFCKFFHDSVLQPAVTARAEPIEVLIVHYPLPNHAFALPAAHALECADRVARAAEFLDAVFQDQAALSPLRFDEYAERAGIENRTRFEECLRSEPGAERIAKGLGLARQLSLPGTPSVIINGQQFSRPPSRERLTAFIDSALAAHSTGRSQR